MPARRLQRHESRSSSGVESWSFAQSYCRLRVVMEAQLLGHGPSINRPEQGSHKAPVRSRGSSAWPSLQGEIFNLLGSARQNANRSLNVLAVLPANCCKAV